VNSLSRHLTAGPDHSRLAFHPDCPICREQRFAGSLPVVVFPAPARAGLLAAALSAGSLFPSSIAAGNPGNPPAAKVSQAAPPAPTPAPPSSPPPGQPSLGNDETLEAPVDEAPALRELLTSPEAGTDTGGEDVSGEGEQTAPAPLPVGQAPAEPTPLEPTPAPLGQPPAPPPPVAQPPAPPQPAPLPQPAPAPVEQHPAAELERVAAPHPTRPRVKPKVPERAARPHRPAVQPVAQSEEVPQRGSAALPVDPGVEAATTTTALTSQTPESPSVPITGRSYTVRHGDSLWSIARRLLGPGASAGRVAREVNRLWELNRHRIGTGEPSLIYAGTVLRIQ
jgi:hypothetical protein